MKKIVSLGLLVVCITCNTNITNAKEFDYSQISEYPASEYQIPTKFWGEWVANYEKGNMVEKEIKKACSGEDEGSYVFMEISPNSIAEGTGITEASEMAPLYYDIYTSNHISGRYKREEPIPGTFEADVTHGDFELKLINGKLYSQGQIYYRCS